MNRYLPVQNERLYEKIVEQIESRVVSGDLETGDQLPPEHKLAEQFGVSRTVVREAIKALNEKGLVEIRSGRGTFVTKATPGVMRHSQGIRMRIGTKHDYANLVEIREILEPEIAALAASRMTDEFISTMQEACEVMEKSYDNPALFIEADLDFHLALAEATQNSLITATIDSLINLLREERKQSAQVKGGFKLEQVYHRKILQAVISHKPLAARQAMKEHLAQLRTK